MKKFIAWLMCGCMAAATLTGCGGGAGKDTSGEPAAGGQSAETTQSAGSEASGSKVINVWSFTDEVPNMIEKYKELHPDFDYEIKSTIIATTDGAYQPALDQALAAGGKDAPDIYCAEAAFVLKYSQGDASHNAAPYEDLGIDVAAMTKDADIAQYAIDIGTNQDGKI
ncbi:MAG: carbohydrate ABC transporter substrate-binding protein, partial [Hungatella hathewayi]